MIKQALTAGLLTLLASTAQAEDRLARGVIQALHQATLSAELSAKVIHMPLRAGDGFEAGDLLVALDCDVFRA